MYKLQNFYIPDRMMPRIKQYIEDGVRPGPFLTAVIQNNLCEACGRADDENLQNLPAYAAYFYNEAPSTCWGSKERMESWMNQRQRETEVEQRNPI